MSVVIFLGAGASAYAGYPMAANLLDEMATEFSTTPSVTEKADWETFNSFRNTASGTLKEILNSSNPELVLTVPDLLEVTLHEADSKNWYDLKRAWQESNQQEISRLNEHWDSPTRESLFQAHLAKLVFQRLADRFLSHRHYRDAGTFEKRKYLREGLGILHPGDCVLTTNWDTLAERTLMELRKWDLGDGYGFNVELEVLSDGLWQRLAANVSPVKVLKLHGSIGWFRRTDPEAVESIYLRKANFLQYMTIPGTGMVRDKNSPAPGSGPDTNPVVIFPSYLKILEGSILQSIWEQASSALDNAEKVVFVGYSLPLADIAIRTLINPLRRRIAAQEAQVIIVNPNRMDLERWKEFLGDSITVVCKRAEEYWTGGTG